MSGVLESSTSVELVDGKLCSTGSVGAEDICGKEAVVSNGQYVVNGMKEDQEDEDDMMVEMDDEALMQTNGDGKDAEAALETDGNNFSAEVDFEPLMPELLPSNVLVTNNVNASEALLPAAVAPFSAAYNGDGGTARETNGDDDMIVEVDFEPPASEVLGLLTTEDVSSSEVLLSTAADISASDACPSTVLRLQAAADVSTSEALQPTSDIVSKSTTEVLSPIVDMPAFAASENNQAAAEADDWRKSKPPVYQHPMLCCSLKMGRMRHLPVS